MAIFIAYPVPEIDGNGNQEAGHLPGAPSREPKFSKKSGTGGNRESKILNNREPGSRERAGTRHRFSSISAQFFTGSKVGSPRIFIFFSFE